MQCSFIGKACWREQVPTRPIVLPDCCHILPPTNVYLLSPSVHAPPTDQQAPAPTLSDTAPLSLSPASSHHKFPESPASSGTPRTASHPCASQSETSP